jgi:hypothetical protein
MTANINTYDKGDVVICDVTFTNESGVVGDPAVVLFSVMDPEGTLTTYTYGTDAALVKDSTGVYHLDLNADIEGMYRYRFYSTGSGKAASEGQFLVKDSVF